MWSWNILTQYVFLKYLHPVISMWSWNILRFIKFSFIAEIYFPTVRAICFYYNNKGQREKWHGSWHVLNEIWNKEIELKFWWNNFGSRKDQNETWTRIGIEVWNGCFDGIMFGIERNGVKVDEHKWNME